ncbi:Endoglucanase Acf2 [Propionibacterium cyclohexanicum]|uniref:glucan endo-1,3-beta-D-glucosidase n=1 Tax=Propionibacterium cyclohexanicum TaxID=64702 RepID=A0A1H9RF39_9ACTN|nr:glycosyl hydrolase [Propionibacterium cyclohexanicum]SER71264.1 Endoglucanase Acf2 [Propionibacterium cyclohexanicum]
MTSGRFGSVLGRCLALAMLVYGCAGPAGSTRTPSGRTGSSTLGGSLGPAATSLSAAQLSPLITMLGARPGADLAPARLGEGLTEPTNRWFSGLVFGADPQPVFPLPLSFALSGTGFSFGLPTVSTSAKSIVGGHEPAVRVDLGADSWKLTRYDEMSITLTASRSTAELGTVVIAEGSPFVSFTAHGAQRISPNPAGQMRQLAQNLWTFGAGPHEYALTGTGLELSGTGLTIPDGAHATWFPVPDGGDAASVAALAASPLVSTSTGFSLDESSVTTTLGYLTADHSPTAIAAMPHQQAALTSTSCSLGSYDSIYGLLTLCRGTSLQWTTTRRPARAALDLSGLSDDERAALRQQVGVDTAALPPYPSDTYFGSKALYRDTQLYEVAKQVGAESQAAALKTRIMAQLGAWTAPSGCTGRTSECFFYDSTNKGIVGLSPSFGAEQYNDHHFHYGYFLYAAAVMALDDPGLVEGLRPVMTLLAADIASPADSGTFPQRRVFDPYASHSWASGTAPFADGNNQESVSEAVNAWAGLSLWAQASGDPGLHAQAQWMQALEVSSALAYWTNIDTSAPLYRGFEHEITPVNWGGKRDYATWFSPEPAAALAILLLPISPSSGYLGADPGRIGANLTEALGTKGYQQTYGDLLLLYSALQGPRQRDEARAMLGTLPSIDDSMTPSYVMAYLDALRF